MTDPIKPSASSQSTGNQQSPFPKRKDLQSEHDTPLQTPPASNQFDGGHSHSEENVAEIFRYQILSQKNPPTASKDGEVDTRYSRYYTADAKLRTTDSASWSKRREHSQELFDLVCYIGGQTTIREEEKIQIKDLLAKGASLTEAFPDNRTMEERHTTASIVLRESENEVAKEAIKQIQKEFQQQRNKGGGMGL